VKDEGRYSCHSPLYEIRSYLEDDNVWKLEILFPVVGTAVLSLVIWQDLGRGPQSTKAWNEMYDKDGTHAKFVVEELDVFHHRSRPRPPLPPPPDASPSPFSLGIGLVGSLVFGLTTAPPEYVDIHNQSHYLHL
jgi:hypothetical protein